jgi:hypothetical protein
LVTCIRVIHLHVKLMYYGFCALGQSNSYECCLSNTISRRLACRHRFPQNESKGAVYIREQFHNEGKRLLFIFRWFRCDRFDDGNLEHCFLQNKVGKFIQRMSF